MLPKALRQTRTLKTPHEPQACLAFGLTWTMEHDRFAVLDQLL